jgi:hypothetical protein
MQGYPQFCGQLDQTHEDPRGRGRGLCSTFISNTGGLKRRFSAHPIPWSVVGRSVQGRTGRVRNLIGTVGIMPKEYCIVRTKVRIAFPITSHPIIQHVALDCGEEFRDAGELLDHTKDMHENSDPLPSANPVRHLGRALDALPEEVPSWSIFPASVAPVPISADRHRQIGRWVSFSR